MNLESGARPTQFDWSTKAYKKLHTKWIIPLNHCAFYNCLLASHEWEQRTLYNAGSTARPLFRILLNNVKIYDSWEKRSFAFAHETKGRHVQKVEEDLLYLSRNKVTTIGYYCYLEKNAIYRKFWIRSRGSYIFEESWDAASIQRWLLFEGGLYYKNQGFATNLAWKNTKIVPFLPLIWPK